MSSDFARDLKMVFLQVFVVASDVQPLYESIAMEKIVKEGHCSLLFVI
jgi:hypothetical protein